MASAQSSAGFPAPHLVPAAFAARPEDAPHVLLILDQFPRSLGGGERIVLRLAALLPQYGFRASILTFHIAPDSALYKEPVPCPIYLLPLERTYDFSALRAAVKLQKFLSEERVRVVQTFFESSDLWAGTVVRMLSDARLIWSRRDMGILRDRKHSVAYRLLAGMPDRVFSVSEQVRRHTIDVDRVDPARAVTIYNGIDVSSHPAPAQWPGTPGEFRITTVGNVRRVKGHDVLVRAAAEVVKRFPTASFTVGGEVLDAEYREELERLIAELQLGSHVRFLGGVRDLPGHLAAADLFVLPSRSEGFSNAIVEAMAAGLPVVATDVGGNAEAVDDGVTGMIVPPEDPQALAAAICSVLSAPATAKAMGVAGRQRAADRFTTAAMMQALTGQYRQVLGS